jgi:hypothetical protein
MLYHFKTKDHPEADGRQAQKGEQAWTFWFCLEEGGKLYLNMGYEGLKTLAGLIDQARADGSLPREQ